MRSGARQRDFPLSFPAILGRDVSGIVRAVGANVKHFKPGDRVLALSNATYAGLVAVDDSDVTHLPDGVDLGGTCARRERRYWEDPLAGAGFTTLISPRRTQWNSFGAARLR